MEGGNGLSMSFGLLPSEINAYKGRGFRQTLPTELPPLFPFLPTDLFALPFFLTISSKTTHLFHNTIRAHHILENGERLYVVLHKDSPFSLTRGSVVAKHRLPGIPSLFAMELTPAQKKDLQRAVRNFLRNKSARTGFIPASGSHKRAVDEAKQLVRDGKENVVLCKVHVPTPPQPWLTPVSYAHLGKLVRACRIRGPRRDIHENDHVFLDHVPAEYVYSLDRFN